MSRIRRFLLCLMMLALPLQGFAAAAMLYCGTGPTHQAVQKAMQIQAATQVSQQSHDHAAAPMMQHDHHAQPTAPEAQAQTDEASDQAQSQLPNASHKCGVCASCCGVLAITDLPQTISAAPLPPSDLAEPFVQISTVSSRQAERPPRV